MDKCTGDGSDFNEGMVCKDRCDGTRPHKIVSGEKICVPACGESGFEFRDGDECKSTCASWVFQSANGQNTCIPATDCTSRTFAEITPNLRECVEKCDRFFTILDDNTYCHDACPEGHYFHDKNTRECKESCDGKPYK